ncbi:helix-turn-helix domain-containing protein [Mycolicibacterium peregrinum]|uniref:helix-turn-helix domain-containing protein n=1 Tax=Mycolicibacterium peregrinum TaxID=43304 RepID=UPI003AAAF730
MDEIRINKAVGAELRAARARQGWSREQLEHESGVKAATLRRYEDGSRSVPVDTLVKLALALKISISDIDKAIRAASSDPPSDTELAAQSRRRDTGEAIHDVFRRSTGARPGQRRENPPSLGK